MKISQREARRLRKHVQALEDAALRMRRAWSQEYFGGVEIARATWGATDQVPTAVKVARKLGHAVVAVGDDGGLIRFVALPYAEPEA